MMSKLKKISEATNVINWFDIPVLDSERARKFYETILDIKMHTQYIEETDEELTFFPSETGVIQATSGRVTGALTRSERVKPSSQGILIYLNASPEIQTVLDRIEPAGGKVLVPKMLIKAGYIAVIMDSEGNRVGLHAES